MAGGPQSDFLVPILKSPRTPSIRVGVRVRVRVRVRVSTVMVRVEVRIRIKVNPYFEEAEDPFQECWDWIH